MNIYFIKDNDVHVHRWSPYVRGIRIYDKQLCECDCDLVVEIRQVKAIYYIKRMQGFVRRSLVDMYYHACAVIANEWTIMNSQIVPISIGLDDKALSIQIEDMRGDNMRAIRPYFNTHREQRSSSLYYDLSVAYWYKGFDIYYLRRVTRLNLKSDYLRKNVWLQLRANCSNPYVLKELDGTIGLPWEITNVPSLVDICLRKLSLFNKVYGGFPDGSFHTVYTMSNLERKVLPALRKLKKPTHTMFGRGNFLAQYNSMTLRMMVKLLDIEKYKGKRVFNFEKELTKSCAMNMNSSAGIRAARDFETLIDDIKFKVTANGKKRVQAVYSEIQIREMMSEIRETKAPPVLHDRAWVNTFKAEVLAGMTNEEMKKFNEKVRDFQICSMTLSRSQRMVHSYRQKKERGNHIAIGINLWNGGAHRIAKKMHYNEKGYTYYTGDFTGLDTTLKAQMLMMYSSFSKYYYNRDHPDYYEFECMLKMVSDNLVFRVNHLYGRTWKTIFGGMPSGAYETSHGDSWIVMYTITMFMLHQGMQNPSRMAAIKRGLLTGEIFFYIYGDDSLWCVKDELTDIINIFEYSRFVEYNFQMHMRDLEETKDFLSLMDPVTGDLRKKGCVFLSKYFIARDSVTKRKDLPDVLPYREFTKIVKKFPFGDGSPRAPVDFVLASIGMVYDSYGTNRLAYDFCHFMYTRSMKRIKCTSFSEVLTKFPENFRGKTIDNLVKKSNLSVDILKRGFPSRDQLLTMHIDDPSKHVLRDDSRLDYDDFF